MAEINPCGWLQNAGATHTAAQMRTYSGALLSGLFNANAITRTRGGVHPAMGSLLQVTQNGSPNMSVNVAAGVAFVPGTESTAQGVYVCENDATVNLAIATAPGTGLNRIDLVVAKVQDSFYSGGVNAWALAVVTGTAAASPSAPAAPNNSITLAQVFVGANVTSIVTGNITDTRFYAVAVGGIQPVASGTELNNIAGKYNGQVFARTDLVGPVQLHYWDGSGVEVFYPWASGGGTLYWPGPRGFMASAARTANSAGITTTETLIDSVTLTAVASRRLKVTWTGIISNNTAGNNTEVRIRYAAGASVTNTGTLITGTVATFAASENHPICLTRDFTGFSAGQLTVGAFVVVSFGGGTATAAASSTWPTTIIIEDIGT